MKSLILKVLKEYEEKEIPMKYYAFDWDDNLMFMPTKIYLIDEDGIEVGMGTEDFAEYRTLIGKKPFEYEGHIIENFAQEPFRDFKEGGDKKFLRDIMTAELADSAAWPDFVEAINNGSLFAIITARGHKPSTLMLGVKKLIDSDRGGIDSDVLYKSLAKMRKSVGKKVEDKETEIMRYLSMCKFYPVSYGEGSAANPEEAKIKAMLEFKSYVIRLAEKLNLKVAKNIENEIGNKFVPIIGFSDDDPRNVRAMSKGVKDIKIFTTHGGKKKEYKPDEEELQLETRIRKILKYII